MQGTITDKPASNGAPRAVPLALPEYSYTYAGTMTISGNLSDTDGQNGTWSGTLNDTLYVTMNSNGTGSAYEVFTGSINLHVVNPDGSTKDAPSPFNFYVPTFSLNKGHFFTSQLSGDPISLSLTVTLNLAGSFSTSQAVIAENMHSPFNGFVNGVLVTGQLNGRSTLTATAPLSMSGLVANQRTYAAEKIQPFKNLGIVDLTGAQVTATVTLSNAAHGTLSAFGSGAAYNKFTGVYTITGSAASVDSALNGLTFDPAGGLGGGFKPVTTNFSISVNDSQGHTLSASTASVVAAQPLEIYGVSSNVATTGKTAVNPFSKITIEDISYAGGDFLSIKLSNPSHGTLSNLGGGFYNKKTGVYVITASAQKETTALRGLVFTPSSVGGTTFTISMHNPAGAFTTNNATKVTAKKAAATAADTGLFTQYVAAGLHAAREHAAAVHAVHDRPAVSHFELAASHG